MNTVPAGRDRPASAGDSGESGPRYSLWEMVLYVLKLNTFGFGGPVALVGYMHRDLVETRKWISEADYKEVDPRATDAGPACRATGDLRRAGNLGQPSSE